MAEPKHARRSHDEIIAALREFHDKWWRYDGTERSGSQSFLNDLFRCYTGVDDVTEVGAIFEPFTTRDKGSGFIDLYWPEVCIIEMKGPKLTGKLSGKPREQALDYWRNSADFGQGIPAPRFVVVCSFLGFEVWEPGRFPNAPIREFSIEALVKNYDSLMFLAGGEPDIGGPGAQLSTKAAGCLADVYFRLLHREADDPDTLRRFILQVTWCLFAEDLGMLPGKPVERLFKALAKDPSRSSAMELGGFFYALSVPDQRERDNTGIDGLPYVNGGLFEHATRVRLDRDELAKLTEAASYDWRDVDPTIFGALMESLLGPERRQELGAHYTYEQDIMSIVEPTIVRPWRERIDGTATPAEADAVLAELVSFRVLDPACGCGNFIAIAYRELRHLTAQALDRRDRLHRAAGGHPPPQRPYYPLSNVHGIEIEPFAVQIARVTLWMTHKLVADLYGLAEDVLPLQDLSNIVCGDALRAEWPDANAIIGNPPYHGTKFMRGVLGDDYIAWLNTRFGVGVKDLCAYWFIRADEMMRPGDRAGLVATNSIREGKNREVLDRLSANGSVITDAISSKVWPGDAKVFVSVVNWVTRPAEPPARYTLDGREVDGITPSLRAGHRRSDPAPLAGNSGRQFYGIVPGVKAFVIDEERAATMLARPEADYSAVVRRYLIGDDIAKAVAHAPRRWVVNFGEMPLEDAMRFPAALDYLRAAVKPTRDAHPKAREREQWWKPSRSVQDTFAAIGPLTRWIACPATGKRFPMVWCEPAWCPSNAISVFAFDDDWSFGVLSSRLHQVWATEVSTKLKGDPRYTTASFATFPFPWRDPAQVTTIEASARAIVGLRRSFCDADGLGLTKLYNAVDEGAYTDLAAAHRTLDLAVCDSYGWQHSTLDTIEGIVDALLALNADIASGTTPYSPFV